MNGNFVDTVLNVTGACVVGILMIISENFKVFFLLLITFVEIFCLPILRVSGFYFTNWCVSVQHCVRYRY
jgi:hypothetical protein